MGEAVGTLSEQRHPHPHLDPRQPRDGSAPGTNPPVFAWRPGGAPAPYRLTVSARADLTQPLLDQPGLPDPVFLPERALPPGRYFWRWSCASGSAPTLAFTITAGAAVVEVPSVQQWLQRWPAGHPRLWIRPELVETLRAARATTHAELWAALRQAAERLLVQPHELAEPPWLPDRSADYARYHAVWSRVLQDTRRFMTGAETLALAYLASGDGRYARAACARLASVARWDPDGSSHLTHNDEAHMPVIWWGPTACDWVWEALQDAERQAVVAHLRRRGQITFEHMHDRGTYGVSRFDSHAGREVVFLAQVALLLHERVPEAATWLQWLRPVLCGIWPVWAGADGAWAEGPSYALAYVQIMTRFASALRQGAGVDLYRRPFWRGHARWWRALVPPYAEWVGFGDGSGLGADQRRRIGDLIELIGLESGTTECAAYAQELRRLAGPARGAPAPLRYLRLAAVGSADTGTPGSRAGAVDVGAEARRAAPAPGPLGATPAGAAADPGGRGQPPAGAPGAGVPGPAPRLLHAFPDAGWAAIRTDLDAQEPDLALLFRSSPFGAISHSHADNNDFALHVGGRALAIPSGYYAGYGSAHHLAWVWHTKSHNCVTLSDAGQLMRSADSAGAVARPWEDERLVYFCGVADASYADRAERCRRHVLYLKPHRCFVLLDEFRARAGVASALGWNLHSDGPFDVDEPERRFRLERGQSALEGHFLHHDNAFFTLSQGWEPPPLPRAQPWPQQHHLRYTIADLAPRCLLAVLLCPGRPSLPPTAVRTERDGTQELAHLGSGGDAVAVPSVRRARAGGPVATLSVAGTRYAVTDAGLVCGDAPAGS